MSAASALRNDPVYRLAQSMRVAWFGAHYAATRRMHGARDTEDAKPASPSARASASDPKQVRAALKALFDADLANIQAGLYPKPRDVDPRRLLRTIGASRRYFEDVPKVVRRRETKAGGVEVRERREAGAYPAYYRQNFHFQTDGWFSERSARLYDTQVEVLFTGTADAMRRAALAYVGRELKGRDQRGVRLVDAACGTGRFLEQALDAYPRLDVTGFDLSPAYAAEAERRLLPWPNAQIVEGNVESPPLDAGAYDIVTSIYLFHELPPRVRPIAAQALAKLVKPGGVLVFADSLQTGDDPNMDSLLENFPRTFHEPYYSSYCAEDLDALFAGAGLEREGETLAFLTKVQAWRKGGGG